MIKIFAILAFFVSSSAFASVDCKLYGYSVYQETKRSDAAFAAENFCRRNSENTDLLLKKFNQLIKISEQNSMQYKNSPLKIIVNLDNGEFYPAIIQ